MNNSYEEFKSFINQNEIRRDVTNQTIFHSFIGDKYVVDLPIDKSMEKFRIQISHPYKKVKLVPYKESYINKLSI